MVYNSVVQIVYAASETGPSPAVALYNYLTTKKIILRAGGIGVAPILNLIYMGDLKWCPGERWSPNQVCSENLIHYVVPWGFLFFSFLSSS